MREGVGQREGRKANARCDNEPAATKASWGSAMLETIRINLRNVPPNLAYLSTDSASYWLKLLLRAE